MNIRNHFHLTGRLGQNPEMVMRDDNRPLVKFSMAVNSYFTDDKGERQQRTSWFPIVVFRENLCKICMDYLRKGSEVSVSGHLNHNVWDSKTRTNEKGEPMKESRTSLIMDELVMHGSSKAGQDGPNNRAAMTVDEDGVIQDMSADEDLIEEEVPF